MFLPGKINLCIQYSWTVLYQSVVLGGPKVYIIFDNLAGLFPRMPVNNTQITPIYQHSKIRHINISVLIKSLHESCHKSP